MRRLHSHALLLVVLASVGCVPNVDGHESLLASPEVLAVRAEPAEVGQNGSTTFTALYVDATGELTSTPAPINWAYCLIRKPLAELGAVASACLLPGNDPASFAPIGNGIDVMGSMPGKACELFGPNPPPAGKNQPAGRPADPDLTGGYMQPLRLLVGDGESPRAVIAQQRLSCIDLPGATPEQAVEFRRRYRRNTNPDVAMVSLVRDGVAEPLGATPVTVSPNEALTLRVEWAACPAANDECGDDFCGIDETCESTDAATVCEANLTACKSDCNAFTDPVTNEMHVPKTTCTGAERYLRFDRSSFALVDAREAINIAWYASAGTYDSNTTGVRSDDFTTSSDNTFVAPASGDVNVVVVIRDDRGGAGWSETLRLHVAQ